MTVRIFGGTDMQLGWTNMVRVRAQRNLGETDYTNSVRPILVISFPESWSGKLGLTDYQISGTDFDNKLTREFAL